MNKVVLIGRLTKDPDLRFTTGENSKAVVRLTLAVDRYNTKTGEKEADFIPVVVWGKQAEAIANHTNKGSQVAVSGRIQTRSYDNQEGKKVYVTEVVTDIFGGVQFLGSKGGNSSSNSFGASNEYSGPANDVFGGGSFDDDIEPVYDDSMPF